MVLSILIKQSLSSVSAISRGIGQSINRRNADSVYHASHMSTCQSLLLMALREFGVGALTQAWMYSGA